MKKRLIASFLAVCAASLIVGCSSDKPDETTTAAPTAPAATSAQTSDAAVSDTQAVTEEAATADASVTGTEAATNDAASTDAAEPGDSASFGGAIGADGLSIVFADQTTVTLGSLADGVIPSLGDPEDQVEAPSCVHPGTDVIYYYDGFAVTTQPDENGNNVVTAVELTSDTVSLANGITVNSTMDDVKAAFGDDFTETFGRTTYTLDKITLDIVSDGSVVTAIAFNYNAV